MGLSPELEAAVDELWNHRDESNPLWMGEAYHAKALVALYKRHDEEALQGYLTAEKYFAEAGNDDGQIKAWSGLASLYNSRGNTERALNNYLLVYQKLSNRPPHLRLLQAHVNVLQAYLQLSNYDGAYPHIQQAIAMADKLNVPFGKVITWYNVALHHRLQNAYDEATRYTMLAIDVATQHKLERYQYNCMGLLSDIYEATAKYNDAIPLLQQCITYFESTGEKNQLPNIYGRIGTCLAATGNWQTAYQYQMKKEAMQKEITEIEKQESINELLVKFEAEKKDAELQRTRLLQVQSELKALKAQMNPHFIYNVMNSIEGLIYTGKTNEAADYLGKFSTLMRRVLEMSGRQAVTVREEYELLNNYLLLEQLRFGNDMQFTITVDDTIDEDEDLLPPLLLQPFVENAVKHGLLHRAGTKQLTINFIPVAGGLQVTIADNGVGRKASAEINAGMQGKPQSFATSSVNDRVALLNSNSPGQVSYYFTDHTNAAGEATGTTVTLLIKHSIYE